MTILSVLSAILRFIGLVSWAGKAWDAHEAKVKTKEVSDAVQNVDRMDDNDVVISLHKQYDRD